MKLTSKQPKDSIQRSSSSQNFKQNQNSVNKKNSQHLNNQSQQQSMDQRALQKKDNDQKILQNEQLIEYTCKKKGHEGNILQYICTHLDCKLPRIACSKCFLQDHKPHSESRESLENYIVGLKPKYNEYYDTLRQFRNASSLLENPSFISEIMNEMDHLKEYFSQRINEVKIQIQRQFEAQIAEQNIKFVETVQKQKDFSCQMELAIQKQIFDMTPIDVETTLKLYNSKQSNELKDTINKMHEWSNEIDQQFQSGCQNYRLNLMIEIDNVMENYQKLTFPQNIDDLSLKFQFLIQKKQTKERLIKDYELIQKEIQYMDKEIFDVKQSLGMNIVVHSHAGQNFAAIPVFECCQQAFKCQLCHDNFCKDHKAYLTLPSKRYCQNCKKIFKVMVETNTEILCVECGL